MIVLFGFLAACGGGGGGGGSGPVVSTLTFQFKTAWGAYQQQTKTFPITLSGTATNAQLGSFPISGSGTVTQTSGTSTQPNMNGFGGTVQAIMVTRVYQFTAVVHGVSVPQTLTDVAYYDPTSFAYMGGTFADNTGYKINNVLIAWALPPDTLKCCVGGSTFYQTSTAVNSPLTHHFLLSVAADTANSVFVNLTDSALAGASRSYRLDNTNTLTPVTENINMAALVFVNGNPYTFNAAVAFNY
jgi:hypothetical protein